MDSQSRPAAQGAIFERFRFVDEPYSFEEEICGIELEIEGTASGHTRVRTGTGKRATAFFDHTNVEFSETWTAANGSFVTVTGNLNFNETKAVPLGGNVFRFTSVEAGKRSRPTTRKETCSCVRAAQFTSASSSTRSATPPPAESSSRSSNPGSTASTRASSTRICAR
jgi:hypothetical protein